MTPSQHRVLGAFLFGFALGVILGLLIGLAAPASATSVETYKQHLDAVTADLNRIADADTTYDVHTQRAACTALRTDARRVLADTRPLSVSLARWAHSRDAYRHFVKLPNIASGGD